MQEPRELADIAQALLNAKEVTVVSHVVPDGDCIGSSIALALGLKSKGLQVQVVNGDPVPEMYAYLKGSEEILLPSSVQRVSDVVVLVDCTDLERAGSFLEGMLSKVPTMINIDHHVSNTYFGRLNYVQPSAAAAGEMVYALLRKMAVEITPEIATALYTALVTDTGSFQYENTTSETFQLAAELVDRGADLEEIRYNLWERKPLISLLLLREVFPTLSLAYDGQVAWMTLDKRTFDTLEANSEHCEGFINYPRSIDGVEVAMFFRETALGEIKVGLRSKKKVDVNLLAAQFGGGGHRRAAGCVVQGTMEEAVNRLVAAAGAMIQD